tara:strand:+ start:276 stop:686 length:411 start_codon:yes stop_codon:yes gene_type:complete
MEHIVGAIHGSTHFLETAQVPLDDLDAICEGLDVLLFARGEVVEDADLLTALKQRLHQMGADETGTSSDYVERHNTPNVMVEFGVDIEIATAILRRGRSGGVRCYRGLNPGQRVRYLLNVPPYGELLSEVRCIGKL